MARPRTPTETLELRGAFKKHPERKRQVGPKSVHPLGDPPAYFAEDEAAAWAELHATVAAGVLTGADRWVVETACRLMAKFRRDWLTGAEMGQLARCLASLGMTPADRSKVHAEPQETKADPYADFLQ